MNGIRPELDAVCTAYLGDGSSQAMSNYEAIQKYNDGLNELRVRHGRVRSFQCMDQYSMHASS